MSSLLRSLLLALVVSAIAGAQTPTPDSTHTTAPPGPELSGVIFANYQYGGAKGNRSQNRFELERSYLTVRATAGERVNLRVTTDVFQQRDSTRDTYYRGWSLRVKYAYAQYEAIRGTPADVRVGIRFGILQTPIVDFVEQHWNRGIASAALDAESFFNSADAGAAASVLLPNGWGEIYGGVWNGAGYTSRETDRFKDAGGRITIYPLAHARPLLRTFSVSPWAYVGARASDFARKRGTTGPVADGRTKDRFGIFVGLRDPRLIAGAEYARRVDDSETADTTVDARPTVQSVSGVTLSEFVLIKPFALANATSPLAPLTLVFRTDRVTPNTASDAHLTRLIGGLGWDLSRRTTVYLDGQSAEPHDGSAAPDLRTWFVHAVVNW